MEDERARKAEALIRKMRADRGYMYPEWEFAASADPDFVEAYNNLYRQALGGGQALDAKTREFVAIGILAFRGQEATARTHMQRALRLGATKQELLEVVAATVIPGGAPTFHCGLAALIKAVEAETGESHSGA